jgi:hypothetical protein
MYSRTSIVYENPFEIKDPSTIEGNFYYNPFEVATNEKNLNPFYYRVRNCDTNLTSDTPANQYQRQKIIQNTVRVASSLYTMNLGALNAYTKPTPATYNVCWNQMSDRPVPSVQKTYVPTGTNNSLNNRHSSVTSSKPGSQSPGGIGCDIKHNSYDRYLNRLKGKAPLRRGVIPPTFGAPIPFNRAFPIYGGKTTKTSIVNNCNCPITSKSDDSKIYNNPLYYPEQNVKCTDIFKVGDYAYTTEGTSPYYVRALIINFNSTTKIYTVQFDDGSVEDKDCDQLKIYFPCDCVPGEDPNAFYETLYEQTIGPNCLDSSYLELKNVL